MSAADLEALANAADDLAPPPAAEGGAEGGEGGAAHVAEPVESLEDRNTRTIGFVLAMLRELTAAPIIFNPPLRTLRDKLPDKVVEQIARPWAKVAAHYGRDLGAVDHPAIGAAITTGPLLWGIGRALALELRERRPVEAATARPEPDSQDPGRAE